MADEIPELDPEVVARKRAGTATVEDEILIREHWLAVATAYHDEKRMAELRQEIEDYRSQLEE